MRLRPYIPAQDFDVLRTWITDPRTHAMWCANLMPFPLERRGFEQTLAAFALKYGDTPFVATANDGKVIGFFSYCLNLELNSGKLKFVVVSPEYRGRGCGREMLALAARYAFEITGADSVRLSVFAENTAALRCYQRAGFVEQRRDEGAFACQGECWTRCEMVLRKE